MTTSLGRRLAAVRDAVTASLVRVIGWYRSYISPSRPPACRFTPSCSEYAIEALTNRGVVMGLGLTAWRLLRCGPWSAGGWDPVPARPSREASEQNSNRVYEGAPR